ncbi:MAG: helix-turn-helix domain-containing protein [Acidobacteriaceae bacterium]
MRAHFEKVTSGAACLLAFERIDLEFPFYWHYHPEFELTLIVDSRGQRLVGDGIADYGPGDLVLLGRNLPHSWRSGPVRVPRNKVHRAVVVQFRENFLGEEFFKLEDMDPIVRLLTRSASGLAFGHTKTGRAVAQKMAGFLPLSPGRRVVSLLNMLLDLAGEADAKALSTSRVRPMCRVEDQQRTESICIHLNDHFEEEIDFAALAQKAHMDQASLCRFFKRATGRTITAYVNELRVGAATQLLTDTDLSIIDICFKVGFGNYSNFNRQFKRIKGYCPRLLRQQFLASGEMEGRALSICSANNIKSSVRV